MAGFRFLYPPKYDPAKEGKMKSFDFIRTLQIDDMVVLQNDRYRGYSDLTLEKFFSTDPQVLEYRQAIVEDLVEHPKLYEVFCQSVSEIQNVNAARCFYDRMYGYVMHGDNLIQYIEEDIAEAQNMMASFEASVPY